MNKIVPKLLVVEDDAVMRSALSQSLKAAGYHVESAENGLQALEIVAKNSFDLIISDIRMPGTDGVATAAQLKKTLPRLKIILITGYSDDEPIIRALNLGIDAILKKPFGMKELLRVVSLKIEERDRESEQEKNQLAKEQKYRTLVAELATAVGEKKVRSALNDPSLFSDHPEASEIQRLATLTGIGQMAEVRQEYEVAIQAYEEALHVLSGKEYPREEIPIRLALSMLFNKTGEMDIAMLHIDEATALANNLKDELLLIDVHHHYARLLVPINVEASLVHLQKAKKLLEKVDSVEQRATSLLLFAHAFLLDSNKSKMAESMSQLLALGKRHFIPQLFVSFRESGLDVLLFTLQEKINLENALWILEEIAPCFQEQLQEILQKNPRLTDLLAPFVLTKSSSPIHLLQVFTFGKLAIFLAGKPLIEDHWKSLKGRSVFLYLLHHYPKLVSEEHLLDTFWPNLNTEKGRHSFRTTLYFIRRTLGSVGSKSLLYHEKQKFGICHGASFACDFLSFGDYYRQAKHDWEKGKLSQSVVSLKEAERLYKGSFLQGWSEEWSLAARGDYEGAFTWVLLSLSRFMSQQNNWKEGLEYAQKALAVDRALEEAHSLSMECLIQLGRRDDAVKQYQVCQEILKKELDIQPSQQVKLLYSKATSESRNI